MSDDFSICTCGKMETLRNISPTYPQIWSKDHEEELEKHLWCISCKKMIPKEEVKYQHVEYGVDGNDI